MSEPGEGLTPQKYLESTNLGSWGHAENEPPTKEHTGAGVSPFFTFVADVQFDFMWIS